MTKKDFPIDIVKNLIEENYSLDKMASVLNTSRPTLSKWLKEHGLETKTSKKRNKIQNIKNNKLQNIIQDYQKGCNSYELGNKYGVDSTTIIRWLKESDIHIRNNSECHKIYSENFNYFNNIDTMDKAYLLGFICADGFITPRNELGIELSIKDENMIKWFKQQLETDKPIYYNEKTKSCGLRIQNIKLTNKIKEYEILPNKTFTINLKNVIEKAKLNDNQIKAFLLGYFDGDGGIYKSLAKGKYYQYSCSITGTLETCLLYKKYFNNIGFITKRYKDNKNNYTYQIGGRNKVKEGLSKLYEVKEQLNFYYQRKYKIFCEL